MDPKVKFIAGINLSLFVSYVMLMTEAQKSRNSCPRLLYHLGLLLMTVV